MDFSDNFHNIKNFVQVDHIEKIMKSRLIFSVCFSQKNASGRKIFPITKIEYILVPDYSEFKLKTDRQNFWNGQ
jgi:hypothetical protein